MNIRNIKNQSKTDWKRIEKIEGNENSSAVRNKSVSASDTIMNAYKNFSNKNRNALKKLAG